MLALMSLAVTSSQKHAKHLPRPAPETAGGTATCGRSFASSSRRARAPPGRDGAGNGLAAGRLDDRVAGEDLGAAVLQLLRERPVRGAVRPRVRDGGDLDP